MNKSIIGKMLMLLTLLFGAMSTASAADRFYIEAVNIEPGETKQLAFILDNSQDFYGFQADISLPEGLEFVKNNGKADFNLSARADDSFSTVSNLLSDGKLRIGAFSTTHTAFTGNSGVLLYTYVRASESFTGGELALSNVLFVDASDRDVKLPDFVIKLSNKHNNSFYIPDFNIAVGETKTISIVLDNETPFTAFQTDLYLPKGLAIVAKSFKMTERGAANHTVSTKSFADGRTRIICMSLSNETFTGNSGALLSFDLTADKDVAETAVIELKNQIFSMANAKEYVLPNSVTTITTGKVLVEEITLNKTAIELPVGESANLIATVTPESATVKEVAWSSSDETVATVSQNGLINAVGPGTATITATASDGSGISASCEVTVIRYASSITLSEHELSLTEGESFSLTAVIEPADATSKEFTWSSSDSGVATVDDSGLVQAVAEGTAVITVRTKSYPYLTDVCNVTVVKKSAIEIVGADGEDAAVDVYSMQGILLRKAVPASEATQGLPAGLYIVGGKKVLVH